MDDHHGIPPGAVGEDVGDVADAGEAEVSAHEADVSVQEAEEAISAAALISPVHRPPDIQNELSILVLDTLRRMFRALEMQSRRLSRTHGLTGPQLVVLQEMIKHPDSGITELARNVRVSQATVTNIVDRLEQRGYVRRDRSGADKRRVLVSATPQGRNLLASNPSYLHQQFLDRFTALESWEQTLILSSLQRVAVMLEAEPEQNRGRGRKPAIDDRIRPE